MHRLAHAILLVGGRYALQLRDNKPGIAAPGMWALFGGHLEEGEDARKGVIREVAEELTIVLPDAEFFHETEHFNQWLQSIASYTFFEADCTALWPRRLLCEGAAAETFTFEEVKALQIPEPLRSVLALHHGRPSR